MNYIDLLLGLGAGILLAVIVGVISDARKEEKEFARKEKYKHQKDHDEMSWHITSANDRFKQIFPKLQEIELQIKSVVVRIDKLEKRK